MSRVGAITTKSDPANTDPRHSRLTPSAAPTFGLLPEGGAMWGGQSRALSESQIGAEKGAFM
jgi:hypothetical protein